MSLYDGFKDVINIAQKVDNIELYRRLLDLSKEALDLQNEVCELNKENKDLKELIDKEKNVIYHKDERYITLDNDEEEIKYCGTCWGIDKKLVPYVYDCCIICTAKLRNGNK